MHNNFIMPEQGTIPSSGLNKAQQFDMPEQGTPFHCLFNAPVAAVSPQAKLSSSPFLSSECLIIMRKRVASPLEKDKDGKKCPSPQRTATAAVKKCSSPHRTATTAAQQHGQEKKQSNTVTTWGSDGSWKWVGWEWSSGNARTWCESEWQEGVGASSSSDWQEALPSTHSAASWVEITIQDDIFRVQSKNYKIATAVAVPKYCGGKKQ
jgi:hypothetical protein